MADVHRRIVAEGFAEGTGPVLVDANHVHPFREGDGRTQFQYPMQLAAHAGHTSANTGYCGSLAASP